MFPFVNGAWSVHIYLLIQTFTGKKAISWIDNMYFSRKQQFEVKNMECFMSGDLVQRSWSRTCGFGRDVLCNMSLQYGLCVHKMLIEELESCGLLVDYCDAFISCLNSQSDGTHSLQRIQWCRGSSDAKFGPNPFQRWNKLYCTSNLLLGWPEGEYFQQILIFGWTTPLIQ